jgi:hypothetical protein
VGGAVNGSASWWALKSTEEGVVEHGLAARIRVGNSLSVRKTVSDL